MSTFVQRNKGSLTAVAALVALVSLAGCASAPVGPHTAVYPGTGKSFEQFRADDASCRYYATEQTGGANAVNAANERAVNSGVVGAMLGALAGAAIGGRDGAAVGAGAGLLMGSADGAARSQGGTYGAQRRYDIAYQQCMYAKGHRVPAVGQMAPQRSAAPAPNYPPPNTPAPNFPPPNTPPPPDYPAAPR